ncbi:hypothetical protein Q3V37_17780 [Micromonospora profundi]|uniref:Uncharacterized protein n=1 Tax=Micromonospora profundi TaxID=1420889 RepID=A0AAJ6HRI3_9ACTN|nr:hypothetical protein [Micromonospora profundi]WLS43268.1 hypothetical protein Q3V37_17780 [Micromonospora profundi]
MRQGRAQILAGPRGGGDTTGMISTLRTVDPAVHSRYPFHKESRCFSLNSPTAGTAGRLDVAGRC